MNFNLVYSSNQDSEESHGGGKKSGSESEHACASLWSLWIGSSCWNGQWVQGVLELLDTEFKVNGLAGSELFCRSDGTNLNKHPMWLASSSSCGLVIDSSESLTRGDVDSRLGVCLACLAIAHTMSVGSPRFSSGEDNITI